MLRVFGIRHHGPGSALSLINAFEKYKPDCILIESPIEADAQIPLLKNNDVEPPIALLIYEDKTLDKVVYLPFANFSPEWQAIQYGLKNTLPIRCIDLPMANQLALSTDEPLLENVVNKKSISKDPLGYLASLQGYSDREQWWNDTFEEGTRGQDIFSSINELIAIIRAETIGEESRETLIREAFMRKQIRKSIKDGFERIAVVCGAWHSPVLQNTLLFKQSADNSILRGLSKIKVKATWIPWSYERLSKLKGYGAGVISPAWYELLFSNSSAPHVNWMSNVSALLRANDFPSSPAHSTEAIRLAQTLATIRDKRIPGLSELDEAATVVFCNGDTTRMEVIRTQLIIGEKVGSIPIHLIQLPIQKDFNKLIKSTRLSKYWEKAGKLWLKSTQTKPRGGLDLRNKNDLLKSQFLYQLHILGISWGTVKEKTGWEKGSFKEIWLMNWDPIFTIQVIESGKWGNSIHAAALAKIIADGRTTKLLGEAAILLDLGLKAGLNEAIRPLTDKMTALLSETEDCLILMTSLPTFVQILEYGDVRKTDLLVISHYVSEIIPRICLELPGYCHQLDEEQSKKTLKQIVHTNAALKVLDNDIFLIEWTKMLTLIADIEFISPEVKGIASRILFDQNEETFEATKRRMDIAMSIGNKPINVVRWLEGFLNGSGLVLVHFPPLWKLIDNWVDSVHEGAFHHILPLLRRTFSNFTSNERGKMMTMAQPKSKNSADQTPPTTFLPYKISQKEKIILPLLKKILGD